MTDLPSPARERWQPLRAGLIDLFHYDAEEFWFHDGRLLLRGNNGTGKSKVLALTLPFLLDGDLSAHRVEPDADAKKRMEWNLLLGGAHPNKERLGYTWLEFGRREADGTEHFLTLGCGLKAVAGRGIARHWFFTTPLRPGRDLSLVTPTGTALSRDRLLQVLEGAGAVHDTARAHRRAVDEALFGLGDHRYGALIDLLVQLRQPQLSKRPSETALSGALTESLPPVDQAVVADVAEAFRALEEDRSALADMREAARSAESFLAHYRRYAQTAVRRRAERPRLAQSRYETARSGLSTAHEEGVRASERLDRAREQVAGLEEETSTLAARREALREAPEMRDAREIDRLATQVREQHIERDRRATVAAGARTLADRMAATLRDLDRDRLRAAEVLAGLVRDVADRADAAGVAGPHARDVAGPVEAAADVRTVQPSARRVVERQEAAIDHVAAAIRTVQQAERAELDTRAVVENLQDDANELAGRRESAEVVLVASAAALTARTGAYLDGLVELRLPDAAAVEADQRVWTETLDGEAPLAVAVREADQAATRLLAEQRADLQNRRSAVTQQQAVLAAERERLRTGQDAVPPVPHTRDPEVRDLRPGLPLWRLVDFADDVPDADRAGIEAALEASGLLDAWVTETHEVVAGDVVLTAAPVAGRTLADILRVAIDPADDDAALEGVSQRVLESVSLEAEGAGGTSIGPGGDFAVGLLRGRWSKPAAEYIGAGARSAARRRRLAEIETSLADLERILAELADEQGVLDRRDDTRERERAAAPDDRDLRESHRTMAELSREAERLTIHRDRADDAWRTAQDGAAAARTGLETAALDVGLPPDEDALGRVRRALATYREGLASLWPAVDGSREAERRRAEHEPVAVETEESAIEAAAAAADARLTWSATAERERTLRATVGEAVDALQRRLDEVARGLDDNATALSAARGETEQAFGALAAATAQEQERTAALDAATVERRDATEGFRRFTATGLVAVALPETQVPPPEQEWAPDPTVRLVRGLERELSAVPMDDTAWSGVQRRVNEEFKSLVDVLSAQGNSAVLQVVEDGFVVDVLFHGRTTTVPDLVGSLGAEVDERSRILDEREREVLENHLLSEVATTLQELLGEAETQVARMNAELEERPTSTGMRLRLRWIPRSDGPSGLVEARRRLRQSIDAWSEQDRSAVGEFLKARIDEVRTASPSGTWLEHLTLALDYRAWNRFVIERFQNEQWHSATGPASGGERVLAASVPLFAAASSHYASAGNPHAPRLVMLDEAFAGVDDNARAKYLGLLAAFDLDVVMTSEREWGCYPDVPGLAIAQLSRVDGVNAVLVSNWRWDGRVRERRPRPDALAVPVHDASVEASQDSLFPG